MSESHYLDVKVFDREYRFACAPEESEALRAAAELVDARMKEAAKAKNMTAERAAVMAAVNFAHETLTAGKNTEAAFDTTSLKRTILAMDARLEGILNLGEDEVDS